MLEILNSANQYIVKLVSSTTSCGFSNCSCLRLLCMSYGTNTVLSSLLRDIRLNDHQKISQDTWMVSQRAAHCGPDSLTDLRLATLWVWSLHTHGRISALQCSLQRFRPSVKIPPRVQRLCTCNFTSHKFLWESLYAILSDDVTKVNLSVDGQVVLILCSQVLSIDVIPTFSYLSLSKPYSGATVSRYRIYQCHSIKISQ